MTILITGSTGHIGRRVAALLTERGCPPRRLARDPSKASQVDGSEVVRGDYSDIASLDVAMSGVEAVFLTSAMAPPFQRARLHGNVIDAAVRAGVRRLVYLSFQGASATSPFPYSADHLLTEAHLRQSGLAYTIMRDSFYLDLLPELAGPDGVIRSPGGNGKVAWVAREDVAQCVAAVLLTTGHDQCIYDVTGPAAFSLEEACRRLATLDGGKTRFEHETLEAGRAWRSALAAEEWEVDVWLGSYLAMGTGELSKVSHTVHRLTGRPALALETYLSDIQFRQVNRGGRANSDSRISGASGA